jgi:hypothetical protein
VELGLRYVHNDTCYPAILVIGQFLEALESGGYDRNHTALLITQTGGGCRASNYYRLLKKAMASTGYNSLQNYIYESSYNTALEITKVNRNGNGFTPIEELQVDVFCNGICAVYKKILDEKYNINPADAADALYEMMPESLKHYWWK